MQGHATFDEHSIDASGFVEQLRASQSACYFLCLAEHRGAPDFMSSAASEVVVFTSKLKANPCHSAKVPT